MPSSFQKCIVFLIPKKFPRSWKFEHKKPDYYVLAGSEKILKIGQDLTKLQLITTHVMAPFYVDTVYVTSNIIFLVIKVTKHKTDYCIWEVCICKSGFRL